MNSLRRNCGRMLLMSRMTCLSSTAVPCSAFSSGSGALQMETKRMTMYSKSQLFSSVTRNQKQFSSDSKSKPTFGKEHFDKLVKNNKLVVFMKGVPDEPRCGFSNAVVQILRMHGVTNYDSHNVLDDENIREGIKAYTNWPTIPQVFINGEFVGGCDILIEMHKNGDLVEQLAKVGIKSALVEAEKTK